MRPDHNWDRRDGDIQYPVALDAAGAVVVIEAWDGSSPVRCPGCGASMVGKRGPVVQWHFAHKADAGGVSGGCSAETALHRVVKTAIAAGFSAAKAVGRAYLMQLPCSRCAATVETIDLCDPFDAATAEYSLCEGTRADVGFRGSVASLACEVVVAHELEADTLKRYLENGISVVTVRPESWEVVAGLATGFRVSDVLNDEARMCEACKRILAEKAEAERQKAAAPRAEAKAARAEVERLTEFARAESRRLAKVSEEAERQWEANRKKEAERIAEARRKHAEIQEGLALLDREGVCEFCRVITRDWWYFDYATGTCRCRPCYDLGRYSFHPLNPNRVPAKLDVANEVP